MHGCLMNYILQLFQIWCLKVEYSMVSSKMSLLCSFKDLHAWLPYLVLFVLTPSFYIFYKCRLWRY
ncbi:hypothetical protein RDI58_016469 [Solanum bulbocastanum]|uniref:Uncharacterized protein n=1 Tax=Solanum bulbocastanum TaxID=147425 RepID=A0AAN8YCH7_SOLBU